MKKFEEKEIVFLNKKLTTEEDLAFSQFLKNRKAKKSSLKKQTEKQEA